MNVYDGFIMVVEVDTKGIVKIDSCAVNGDKQLCHDLVATWDGLGGDVINYSLLELIPVHQVVIKYLRVYFSTSESPSNMDVS